MCVLKRSFQLQRENMNRASTDQSGFMVGVSVRGGSSGLGGNKETKTSRENGTV